MKIKKGDKVLVISGKNRGKVGKVTEAFPVFEKILIEGINLQKKHIRPRKQGEKGQIVEIAAPMRASNVKLICDKCNKPTRISHKREGDKKYRVCKKCNQVIK